MPSSLRSQNPRSRFLAAFTLPILAALACFVRLNGGESEFPSKAEYHFVRLEYADRPEARRGWQRGWWMQDWPEADAHFAQGVRRLTRIDIGESIHLPLTDDRLFNYPWIYATQVGFWDLTNAETDRLREYLLRGGFLVVDDFHGLADWEVFRESMQRVLPDQPILEIEDQDTIMHLLYDIRERTMIPGLRHFTPRSWWQYCCATTGDAASLARYPQRQGASPRGHQLQYGCRRCLGTCRYAGVPGANDKPRISLRNSLHPLFDDALDR
jgi:hypothetical protein